MKATKLFLLLGLPFMGGCQTTSYVTSALDGQDLGAPLKSVRADGIWSTGEPGHGLEVQVRVESDAGHYQRNLDLELEGAARACAALSRSDRVLEWAYIDVYYSVTYQPMIRGSSKVVGVAQVIVRRETLMMLRDQQAPASAYPEHWRFVAGYKDQPDSDVLLSW